MRYILEHPDITCALRTGYPSWMQDEDDQQQIDEDALYEDYIYEKMFGDRGE